MVLEIGEATHGPPAPAVGLLLLGLVDETRGVLLRERGLHAVGSGTTRMTSSITASVSASRGREGGGKG